MNEDTAITLKQQPVEIVNYAQDSARQLVQLVRQNHWSVKIGAGEHLRFEAWQTVGRFFGYTVKTESTEYVEYGGVKGFNAKAIVLDKNGQVVGGAESLCLSDEKNWYGKPLFSLKSMAQTRACGKALRQVLAWVVVLAGFKATPAEEMSEDLLKVDTSREAPVSRNTQPYALMCSQCGADISQKVAAFSKGKYNTELCFNCQKKADNPTPKETETMLNHQDDVSDAEMIEDKVEAEFTPEPKP